MTTDDAIAVDSGREELLIAVEQLLAIVWERCANWRFRENVNRAVATAGMARAADLLHEALRLAKVPPSVGANILVRAAFEAWLVGVWALFGGDDAVLGIEKERVRNEKILASSNELPAKTINYIECQRVDIARLADELLGSGAPSSVKYDQMARALTPLVKERTGEAADMSVVYNLLYRAHSTNDAHPWKVMGQYLQEGGLGLRVESVGPWQDPLISIAVMAMYVATLGRWIELERGGDGTTWSDRLDAVRVALDQQAPANPGSDIGKDT
jgi:hypothetical protein